MRTKLGLSLGLMSTLVIGVAASSGGCLNRPIEPVEPRTTSTIVERITQTGVDKIDIVLAIDNSSSMDDKQAILAAAVPDLVDRLVNPLCVDKDGNPAATQPASPTADCGTGFDREFKPIVDINIGIVDSSLGADGADQCSDTDTTRNNNDHGHLVTRGQMGMAATYQNKGFLAWDPNSKRGGTTDQAKLKADLTDLVIGTGQIGCGYEHQLESVVRFLVDPTPYGQLDKGSGGIPPVTPSGTDQTVLQQRKDFLRSNSLLAIIMLTDENDCSINILGPQNYAVLNQAAFFRAAGVCATNPNDKCCYSCGLGPPSGCSADPVCSNQKLSANEDPVNLKCWNQKKRYGFDALFPVKRYVNAFSMLTIDPAKSDLDATGAKSPVQNPIFTDLTGTGQPVRDPGLVFFAGIVGVPYQVAARDPADLSKGFKSFDELSTADSSGSNFWTKYVGDPDGHVDPTDPIMVEDYKKRGVPAGSPNGGDRSIDTTAPTDLQYTCIFDLPTPKPMGGDCKSGTEPDNPLCTAGGQPQIKAKAYPGLRELGVIHGLAGQGIVASICPQNVSDPSKANYGYRPAVGTIIDRLKSKLGGQCLPRKLNADPEGNVPCIVLEASHNDNGQVDCSTLPGRQAVDATHKAAIDAAKADPLAPKDANGQVTWNSFCEIKQLAGKPSDQNSDKYKCQNIPDPTPDGLDGWCYIDAAATPPVGDPAIVAKCPPNEQRLVRFVGKGAVQSGATALITCSGDTAQ